MEAFSCGCGGPHLLKENSFQGEVARKNDSEQSKERDDNHNLYYIPKCNHGEICKERVVISNTNRNKGRIYYKCNKNYDRDPCDFFHWKDNCKKNNFCN